MHEPLQSVEIGAIGPYDVIEIRCWHCGKQTRWGAKDVPKSLPAETSLKSLEPKLVCRRCKRRGEARIYFYRPAR